MRKLVTTAIIFFSAVYSNAADLKDYRDTPLFCSKVEENHLPYGEYCMVRSYRNFTQLLVSDNRKIILYTDRDNQKDSEIFVSAYSPREEIHINVPSIQQHEFNLAIEKLIRKGDNSSTSSKQFPGGEKFIAEIIKEIRPAKENGEYFIYLKDNGIPYALMTLNMQWKKITIRNILDENKAPSSFYSIYIDECYDKNIKRIVTEYISVIKKSE